MTQFFEAGIIKKLSEYIKEKINIKFEFLFSPSMDIIKEYRKNGIEKINFSDITNFEKQITNQDKLVTFAIWKRTPITISQNSHGPYFRNFDDLVIKTNNGYTARKIFNGECEFNVIFFSNENKILYDFEIFFNTEIMLKNPLIFNLKYLIDDEILEIPYNLNFNGITSFDFINIENYGSLQYIETSFKVDGILFSPVFVNENNTIKTVDVNIFVNNKSEEIEFNNINQLKAECIADVENKKININTIKTKNNFIKNIKNWE